MRRVLTPGGRVVVNVPGRTFLWEYIHSTPLAAAVANLDSEARAALERDIAAGWLPFMERGGLVLELGVTVGTGRA
jgi:hypothetical protein